MQMISRVSNQKACQKLMFYVLFFFAGCFMGFLWEVLVYWINHNAGISLAEVCMELRGFLHGPWVPIYGAGCVLMLLLHSWLPGRPIRFFLVCTAASSILEFTVSWGLELLFDARWWDYSSQFLNLDGRICLGSSLFFGAAGMFVIYVLEPLLRRWFQRLARTWVAVLCICLSLAFLTDVGMSFTGPNMGIGVTVMAAKN